MWRLKISQGLKQGWRQELLDYITIYNSTPHSVTEKSPSELFFRRKFKDKIPQLLVQEGTILNEEMRDKHRANKQLGKEYADRKRKATETAIGDKVYVKNMIRNKTTPDFDSTPHTI